MVYTSVVNLALVAAGDFEAFDIEAARANLLTAYPIAVDAIVTATAGSVNVNAQLIMSSSSDAAKVSDIIAASTVSDLTSQLKFKVLQVTSVFASVALLLPLPPTAPPHSPPLLPPEALAVANVTSSAQTANAAGDVTTPILITVLCVVGLIIVVMLAVVAFRWKKAAPAKTGGATTTAISVEAKVDDLSAAVSSTSASNLESAAPEVELVDADETFI